MAINFNSPAEALAAVTENGMYLRYVPDPLKTDAVVLAAVTKTGRALRFVPVEMLTEALVLTAVTQSGAALEYVPPAMKTEAVVLTAMTRHPHLAYKHVPPAMFTEALALATVNKHGRALNTIPAAMRTKAVIKAALAKDVFAIAYAPFRMLKEAMVLDAVTQNGLVLEFVDEYLKTDAVVLAAVNQNGLAIEFVPSDKLVACVVPAANQINRANEATILATANKNALPIPPSNTTKYFAYGLEDITTMEMVNLAARSVPTWLEAADEAMQTDGYAYICRQIEADDLPVSYRVPEQADGEDFRTNDPDEASLVAQDLFGLDQHGDVIEEADESRYKIGDHGLWVKPTQHRVNDAGPDSYSPISVEHPHFTNITGTSPEACLRQYAAANDGYSHPKHHIKIAEAVFDANNQIIKVNRRNKTFTDEYGDEDSPPTRLAAFTKITPNEVSQSNASAPRDDSPSP